MKRKVAQVLLLNANFNKASFDPINKNRSLPFGMLFRVPFRVFFSFGVLFFFRVLFFLGALHLSLPDAIGLVIREAGLPLNFVYLRLSRYFEVRFAAAFHEDVHIVGLAILSLKISTDEICAVSEVGKPFPVNLFQVQLQLFALLFVLYMEMPIMLLAFLLDVLLGGIRKLLDGQGLFLTGLFRVFFAFIRMFFTFGVFLFFIFPFFITTSTSARAERKSDSRKNEKTEKCFSHKPLNSFHNVLF